MVPAHERGAPSMLVADAGVLRGQLAARYKQLKFPAVCSSPLGDLHTVPFGVK